MAEYAFLPTLTIIKQDEANIGAVIQQLQEEYKTGLPTGSYQKILAALPGEKGHQRMLAIRRSRLEAIGNGSLDDILMSKDMTDPDAELTGEDKHRIAKWAMGLYHYGTREAEEWKEYQRSFGVEEKHIKDSVSRQCMQIAKADLEGKTPDEQIEYAGRLLSLTIRNIIWTYKVIKRLESKDKQRMPLANGLGDDPI